jgi:uncharacterized protein YjbI with pentapeptide repeats
VRRIVGIWRELLRGGRSRDASTELPSTQAGGRRRLLWATLISASSLGPSLAPLQYTARVLALSRFNALQVLLRAGVQFEWIRGRFCSRIFASIGDITHSERCLPVLELAGARLDRAKLRDLDFSGRSLRGASFDRARLTDCRFDRADLTEARLERAQLQGVSLVGAVLRRARFDNAYIANCRFDCADAEEAVLDAANIQPDVSMRFLSLRRASLQAAVVEADLTGVDSIGANLANAFMDTSRAVRAKLPTDPVPAVELAPITLGAPHLVAWSPDDACLLVLSRGSAWLIDAGDGALIRRFQDPGVPILAAAFRSPTEVVVATAAGTLAIHDLQNDTKREIQLGIPLAAIALSGNGMMFAAVATIPAGPLAGRMQMVFGRSNDLASAIPLDSAALPLGDFHISSIAVDDGATTAAVLVRSTYLTPFGLLSTLTQPTSPLNAPADPRDSTHQSTSFDVSVTRSYLEIFVVRRDGVSLAASSSLLRKSSSAGARVLLRGDGKVVAIADDGDIRYHILGDIERGSDRLEGSPVEGSRVATLSPDGGWLDPRDSEWADALPVKPAERMTTEELPRLPFAVHAHRGHEVAVADSGIIATVDRSIGLCRRFELTADPSHAASDPPCVVDDVCFLDHGRFTTAGLGTVRTWDLQGLCEVASSSGGVSSSPIVLLADGRGIQRSKILGGTDPGSDLGAGRAICAGRYLVAMAITDPVTARITTITMHDLRTGAREVEFVAPGAELAALGEGDRWLAFASGNQVTVVDLDTEHGHTRDLASKPTALAFFEGQSCVIGDTGGRLQIFDRPGAFALHEYTLQISAAPVTALAVAGSRFAIATGDGKIHTWTSYDRAPAQLAGLPGATSRLAFSPDGSLLAAATDDDIVRVFDMASRTLAARLYHLEAGWAAVRADGKYDYRGDVSRLSCVSGLRTYRLRDLDELLPGRRLPRPR